MKNKERYIRQTTLPEIGVKGQSKLKKASVLVIGAGGLSCAILPYLTTSGVGVIGIVDGDTIATSNLHRQVLYTNEDVGLYKATIASKQLKVLNPDILIKSHTTYLNGDNALSLFEDYDIIVDATDRISARYLINDACVLLNKPFVHGSIYKFQSQISVFNYKNGPTYRCLYPEPDQDVLSCSEVGVLGTTVALAGALQANEILKIILEIGNVLSGKLLMIDSLTNEQSVFDFKKNTAIQVTQDFFENEHQINRVFYASAKAENHLIIDVRQPEELPEIKAENILQISLSNLELSIKDLPKKRTITLFCQSGIRSRKAYKLLKKHNVNHIYCLNENAPNLTKILL
tara:strand:+ start:7977 stop:9011 length:1035 start_codon:yes stop_codon:yes gene_type:complete